MMNTQAAAVATIHRGYTMDFTAQIEFAQRADGQWFMRGQYRDPRYGYKWGAWRETAAPHADRFLSDTGKKPRLPKGGR